MSVPLPVLVIYLRVNSFRNYIYIVLYPSYSKISLDTMRAITCADR